MTKLVKTLNGLPVREGAGVRLRRIFGFNQPELYDPFLLLDDFHSSRPEDYLKGFPWHPHRGIETITYLIEGEVDHQDSLGNKGTIGPGDVQWMTAGGGIIHQEMPRGDEQGRLWGLQLWANLPASEKMGPPRYRGFTSADIPEIPLDKDGSVKVIAGTWKGTRGPVEGVAINPEYFDVILGPDQTFFHTPPPGENHLIYLLRGDLSSPALSGGTAGLLESTGTVNFTAGQDGARFIWISGRPLKEPIAWQGPIVMNTQEELREAFRQYQDGTFLDRHTR